MNKFILSLLVALPLIFISCEKHDGHRYLSQKCELELDGEYYIDQCPWEYILSPNAIATPYIYPEIFRERKLYKFVSHLSVDRESAPCIYISATLFADSDSTDLDGKTFTINRDNAFDADKDGTYLSYCIENGINHATVNSSLVDYGSFTIQRNNDTYDGTFELTFTDDSGVHTAKGRLSSLVDFEK